MAKTNKTVKCPYCDKVINAQGLGGHVHAKHGIIIRKQVIKEPQFTALPVKNFANRDEFVISSHAWFESVSNLDSAIILEMLASATIHNKEILECIKRVNPGISDADIITEFRSGHWKYKDILAEERASRYFKRLG